jgi:hypothetical protein
MAVSGDDKSPPLRLQLLQCVEKLLLDPQLPIQEIDIIHKQNINVPEPLPKRGQTL